MFLVILTRESCRIFGNSWITFFISSSFSVEGDNGEIDDELSKGEFVILSLENVLVEGVDSVDSVEGDYCADVLDVLGGDGEHP